MHHSSRSRLISIVIALSLILLMSSNGAYANTCDKTIRRNNIIGNAVFTLIFRAFNGKLNSWQDAGESLSYGAANGYLFYQSRRMIGAGDESAGLALAYLAASANENISSGQHPLAKLRYGIGPLEVNWHTPFGGHSEQPLDIAVNTLDAIGVAGLALQGSADNFRLRNGVIVGRDQGAVADDYSAIAMGRTIVIKEPFENDQALFHHELIHTTQYLQFSSFGSTNFDLMRFDLLPGASQLSRPKNIAGIGMSMRIEWFNTLINWVDSQRDYHDRWFEIEAARIGQHTSPLHNDNDTCTAQLGFEFKF